MRLRYYQKAIKDRGFKLTIMPVETKSGTRYKAVLNVRKNPSKAWFGRVTFGKLFLSKETAAMCSLSVLDLAEGMIGKGKP